MDSLNAQSMWVIVNHFCYEVARFMSAIVMLGRFKIHSSSRDNDKVYHIKQLAIFSHSW
jgi:hypothetical protein